ncbi:hypothetical protein YC2023_057579 [Brassica napus]
MFPLSWTCHVSQRQVRKSQALGVTRVACAKTNRIIRLEIVWAFNHTRTFAVMGFRSDGLFGLDYNMCSPNLIRDVMCVLKSSSFEGVGDSRPSSRGFVNWRLDYQRRQRDCRQLLWSFQICRESGSVPNPMVKNIREVKQRFDMARKELKYHPAAINSASYACHHRRPPFEYLRTPFQDWFDVRGERLTRRNLNFKLSNSPLSICFSDLTAFAKITEPSRAVPVPQFRTAARLGKHQHIFQVTLSNSATLTCNLTLFNISIVHLLSADTIGELTAIRDTVDDSLQGKESHLPAMINVMVMTMRKIQLLKQSKVVCQPQTLCSLRLPRKIRRHTLHSWRRMQFLNHRLTEAATKILLKHSF